MIKEITTTTMGDVDLRISSHPNARGIVGLQVGDGERVEILVAELAAILRVVLSVSARKHLVKELEKKPKK